jgi:hypothetical protein
MPKLVITTLHYAEARALLKKVEGKHIDEHDPDLREAVRKLAQGVLNASPLEKRNGKVE